MSEPMSQTLSIEIPEDLPTAYADFASIWHTNDVFVLDFISQKTPAEAVPGPDGTPTVAVACRVVQRVRIPPTQVFELMKAMEAQLSGWEADTGRSPGGSSPEA
jgi:hypothetical protein